MWAIQNSRPLGPVAAETQSTSEIDFYIDGVRYTGYMCSLVCLSVCGGGWVRVYMCMLCTVCMCGVYMFVLGAVQHLEISLELRAVCGAVWASVNPGGGRPDKLGVH